MPKRTGIVVAAVVGAVLLIGGGTAVALTVGAQNEPSEVVAEATPHASESADDSGEAPEVAPTEQAGIDVEALTAPGGVCHPNAGSDFPCLAVAPDLAVLNMTGQGRAGEPLVSLPDEERLALAHEACEVLASGGNHQTTMLVETTDPNRASDGNNFAVFSAGAAAYCPQYAEQWVQDELAKSSASN